MLLDELRRSVCEARKKSILDASLFEELVVPKILDLAFRYRSTCDVGIAKILAATNDYIAAALKLQELFSESEPSASVVSWINAGFDARAIVSTLLDDKATSPAIDFLDTRLNKPLQEFLELAEKAKQQLIAANRSGRNANIKRQAFLIELSFLLHQSAGMEISSYDESSFVMIGLVCLQFIEDNDELIDISRSAKAAVKQFQQLTGRHKRRR